MKAKVLESESTDKCIDLIEEFIIKRLLKAQGSNYIKQLSNAFQLMNAKPDVRMEELASEACLSERQFRRVFIDNVGMSPKQIQRIQRFHLATNEMLQSKVENIEHIVYKYGYTDHSHFNREFHEIAGMSPTEYLNSLESIRKHGIMPIYRSYHVSK
ncbi:MAG: AraC family transcriptional regulator [Bacteroidales bacterium]|nr:AraC family transcriptional regulator [Candidatus Scybalocola fimicaballi]